MNHSEIPKKNENLKNKDIPTNSESEVENEVKDTPEVQCFTVIDQQVIAKNNKSDSLCTGFNSAHSHYWVEDGKDALIKDLQKDMKKREQIQVNNSDKGKSLFLTLRNTPMQ